nr:ribonuclease H-like domain-containing protein [Tanacetum cinerariifolium]
MFDCDEMFSSESGVSMPASSVYDRYKSGEGYHVVPPLYTGTFMPPKPALVFHDAPIVNETILTAFNVKPCITKPTQDLSQTNRPFASIIEDWVSDLEDGSEGEHMPTQKAASFVQTSKHVKPPRPSVKRVEYPIPTANLKTDIPKSRGHGNNRNRKACFVCKSLTHLIKDFLTRSRLVSLNFARPVNTVVPQTKVHHQRLVPHGVHKPYSLLKWHIKRRPSPLASNFYQKVTTSKAPQGNPQHALKEKGVIDSGCSRHMIGNMSYLTDFKEINGGYVAFGRNLNGGNITDKGKIKTGKLDFDDVYFVKELKFNIFSVSQMCDKKNNVLFTDAKCIVLSLDFKLPGENHVLLRVPRENNMYNVDLKNIVPSG